MQAWQQEGLSLADYERLVPLDKLELRMLLMHATGKSRIQLITHSDQSLTTAVREHLLSLISRRLTGEPVAYILGEREFFGLSFVTSPAVLIPRADTELLVELALQHAPPNSRLLDMGTGSGAIAISIAHEREDLAVSALDISADALAIATQNAARLLPTNRQQPFQLLQSDWFAALGPQGFNTIVSNPPYIEQHDPHLSQGDLRFEPLSALTDHADGLSAYRHIVSTAKQYLSADGWLLMEHGYDQAEAVRALLLRHQYTEVQSWRDLAGIERVSGGKLQTEA
ncbi:peptide chain release factor N(5)-glutamine methyltransferase [Undibacterium crateris]|uniref:peptide chain release factor N(5)-glutamine methyltransferase n=1 Tax=Undibacterium crateris TaxID=2528175 RepID=UPI001389ADFB|nr:peptide chain release factor N(5)-glutamine methyltransferase [Undibacterium crateris]NDI84652.1 peptide chain release factor N(5)-glutamine methyltransferase [Undibacterium crateris]